MRKAGSLPESSSLSSVVQFCLEEGDAQWEKNISNKVNKLQVCGCLVTS